MESRSERNVPRSHTLGLKVSAELEVSFDDETRTMRVETLRSRWGTYTATLRVADDDSASRVTYESAFGMLTVMGLRVPFVDAKLHRFTEQIVAALQSSVVQTSWRDDFAASFEQLVMPLVTEADDLDDATRFDDVRAHLDRLMRYNVVGGKAYRALLVRLAAESLASDVEPRAVHAVGWMIEMLQAMALVADDIMDGSETRRGKVCWYRDVGTACAINDSLLLYSATYRLLANEFEGRLFEKLARLFFDTAMQTCVGQHLDTASENKVEYATAERYAAIVRYKTTFYTIHAPLAAGVLLAQRADEEELLANVGEVSAHIGQLFQEQDDYLDVFGDASVTGKVGTDVWDGKTTWIFAYALERADEAQRDELTKHYGSKDADVARVRALFGELGVHEEYAKRQKEGAAACLACALPALQTPATAILAELMHRKA